MLLLYPNSTSQEYSNISSSRVESMERRLKGDVLAEARENSGRVLVTRERIGEDSARVINEEWEECDAGKATVTSSTCAFQWAGLTWDLSPLARATPVQGFYEVRDAFDNPGQNWTYLLGICADVSLTGSDFEERSKLRKEEIEAIKKAIEIISGEDRMKLPAR